MDQPAVSVVVATHNRAGFLPALFAAIERQDDVPSLELVVVDDYSTDETPAMLQRLADEASFPVTVIRTEQDHGPAHARNRGWRAARAPLIAFTDDDCVPDRRWLAALTAALRDADLAQGMTEADAVESAERGPFARCLVITQYSWKFETCNMGYHRTVLERTGGFDERFRAPFGEDCDLAWRALELGATGTWAPDAVVIHRVETSGNRFRDWIAWLRDTRRLSFAPLIVRRHPQFREHLFWRWFWKPHHPLALLAAAGLAIAARRSNVPARIAAAALLLPWLCYRTVIEPMPARRRWLWAVLPLTLVGDAATIAATARGSIRHRALLL